MPRITKRVVDAAALDQCRRFTIWGHRRQRLRPPRAPSGIKSYVFNYRTPRAAAGARPYGKHGSWTPEQARSKAEALRLSVAAGRDPLGEKQALRAAPTVSEVLDAYLASERFAAKAPSTQGIDRGRIERHLKPLLGNKHVHALTPGDVERASPRSGTARRLRSRRRSCAARRA
jgi:hypothetical protein